MHQVDPLAILLSHDQWATRQILEACSKLTSQQFQQHFEMGPGSLHNTTTHILGAMRIWTQVMAGQTPGVRIDQDGQTRTPQDLLALADEICGEFAAQARRLPLDQIVTRTREGKSLQLSRAEVLMQVLTHGVHHRAQCLNMLRQLGVSPLPRSSVIEWVHANP